MKAIFVDTNLFLQCRDLKELAWNDVFKDDEIHLLIPSAVRDEIDRHKNDGNSRRAKKARKISSLFRKMFLSEEQKEIIREAKPRVELSFSSETDQKYAIPNIDFLDLSRADNRIIREALYYAKSKPDTTVAFLTHDTNPLLTAKRCGLQYSIIPEEWLLPAESDPRDKRIAELERKVKELEKTYPIIDVKIEDSDNKMIESLSITITEYDDFSEQEIEKLISEVQYICPLITDYDLTSHIKMFDLINEKNRTLEKLYGITEKYEPPSEDEINTYTEEEYPSWIESVREFFVKLPRSIEFNENYSSISFILTNSGIVPAENITVQFNAKGEFFLRLPTKDKDKGKKKRFEFPIPPSPPKGRWVKKKRGLYSIMDNIRDAIDMTPPYPIIEPIMRRQRDRNAFYLKNDESPPLREEWSFECQEFRHKVAPERFDIDIFIFPEAEISNAALDCLITSKNLPNPIVKTVPIKVNRIKGDIMSVAHDILRDALSNRSHSEIQP